MAKMYPPQLPDRVLNDRKLKGEIKTYEALKALSDEFEVFYNRCPDSKRGSKAHKRRIDFIVLHEKLGLLAIEVKGGKIRIGQDGGFEQYHPSKKAWAPTDPYRQVEVATISLVKSIREDGGNYWIPDDTCVVFPDTTRRDITDQPQSLPRNTLCADDLGMLPTQIPTFFSESKGKNAWSRDAFLDMRRRLQNMPEAPRGATSAGEATKTTASKAPKWKRKARAWSPKNPFVAVARKPEPPKVTPEIPEEDDEDVYEIDDTAPRAPYLRQKPPEYPYTPPPEESASPWVARRHHLIRVMGIGTAAIATFIASVAGFLWLIRWVRG